MKKIISCLMLLSLAACSEGFDDKNKAGGASDTPTKTKLEQSIARKYESARIECIANVDKFLDSGEVVASSSHLYILNDFLQEIGPTLEVNFNEKVTNGFRLKLALKMKVQSNYNGIGAVVTDSGTVTYGYKNALKLSGSLDSTILFTKAAVAVKVKTSNPSVRFFENQDFVVREAVSQFTEKDGTLVRYDYVVSCMLQTELKEKYEDDNTVSLQD